MIADAALNILTAITTPIMAEINESIVYASDFFIEHLLESNRNRLQIFESDTLLYWMLNFTVISICKKLILTH